MPFTSEQQEILEEVEATIMLMTLEEEDEDAEDLFLIYLHLLDSYTAEHAKTKQRLYYITERFPNLTANGFRSMFRMTQEGFFAILDKIEDHSVFSNNSTYRQAHPSLQLAVALTRLGLSGTGASVNNIRSLFGISAGTVTIYTNRVIEALMDILGDWIVWPDAERRRDIGRAMRKEGFPNCVGFIGGTTIPLAQKPAIDGGFYYEYKKRRYSVAMQVICDPDRRIIGMHVGLAGSCEVSAGFPRMPQYKQPHLFFSPGEYLLADSEYDLSMTCVPAYKDSAADSQDIKEFNYCVAKSRVRNEHCVGILKSRWASLQEMRQQIRSAAEMRDFCRWVAVCCALHNMLDHFGDTWEDMYLEEDEELTDEEDEDVEISDEEDEDEEVSDEEDTEMEALGDYIDYGMDDVLDAGLIAFRETLKKTTLETNYALGVLPLT